MYPRRLGAWRGKAGRRATERPYPLDGIFRSHNIPRSFPFLRHAPRRRGYFANVHDTASFPHRFFQSTAASRAMSRR